MLKIMLMSFIPLLTLPLKNYWVMANSALFITFFTSLISLYNPLLSLSYSSDLLMLDQLSTSMVSLTLWISTMMLLASSKIKNNATSPLTFTTMVLALNMSLLATFMSQNLFLFYVFFEASLIPTFLLIMGWGYQTERIQASMYLLLYTISSSLPLLASLSIIYSNNSSLSMILNQHTCPMNSNLLTSIWWLMSVMAFLVKMPLFMTHIWLPKAHVEAPVAGSMVLAGVLLKLGSYGLMRMTLMFTPLTQSLSPLISSIALFGACLTSLICIRQTDMKSLIAYSSVGHMGLMTAGIMTCSQMGLFASLTLMIAHGLCSSGLFLMANISYESSTSRSLMLNKGMLVMTPIYSMMWFMLLVTNMAAPPSINLMSEVMLISSTMSSFHMALIMLALMSFLSAIYSLTLYASINHGNTSTFYQTKLMPKTIHLSTSLMHLMPLYLLISSPNLIFSF